MRASLPPFDFDQNAPEDDGVTRQRKPLVVMEDGKEYEGEWDSEGQRSGKGVSRGVDGSLYEGFWLNGQKNGKGRSIEDYLGVI